MGRLKKLIARILEPFGYLLLSNGFFIKVRPLGLYELDNVQYNEPEPFVYEYVNNKTGKTMRRVYDISQWTEPPSPPNVPEHECEPGSFEADLWHVYNTYQAALLHRINEVKAAEQYAHDVGRYVLDNCVSFGLFGWLYWQHRPQVTEPADYSLIYQQALTPEVGWEDIEAALASTFPGILRPDAHSGSVGLSA